jgi:hypothetical protein
MEGKSNCDLAWSDKEVAEKHAMISVSSENTEATLFLEDSE